eukprot:TRINITY_DN30603_c0_g1_i1.p1 TRINITY_DN30603_c0_g1~~TRINITY_DN30603_c0_g1_i1.p1  ORF type:complete len:504 (-),score=80.53 TRINITY_DN30603_c0_g1_i1:253-1695(-)
MPATAAIETKQISPEVCQCTLWGVKTARPQESCNATATALGNISTAVQTLFGNCAGYSNSGHFQNFDWEATLCLKDNYGSQAGLYINESGYLLREYHGGQEPNKSSVSADKKSTSSASTTDSSNTDEVCVMGMPSLRYSSASMVDQRRDSLGDGSPFMRRGVSNEAVKQPFGGADVEVSEPFDWPRLGHEIEVRAEFVPPGSMSTFDMLLVSKGIPMRAEELRGQPEERACMMLPLPPPPEPPPPELDACDSDEQSQAKLPMLLNEPSEEATFPVLLNEPSEEEEVLPLLVPELIIEEHKVQPLPVLPPLPEEVDTPVLPAMPSNDMAPASKGPISCQAMQPPSAQRTSFPGQMSTYGLMTQGASEMGVRALPPSPPLPMVVTRSALAAKKKNSNSPRVLQIDTIVGENTDDGSLPPLTPSTPNSARKIRFTLPDGHIEKPSPGRKTDVVWNHIPIRNSPSRRRMFAGYPGEDERLGGYR